MITTSIAVAVLALTLAFQEPASSPSSEPVQGNSPNESSGAASTPPASEGGERESPKPQYERPRRGRAPSASDVTDVEHDMNSDGTIRRRVVRVGGVINEGLSDPEPRTLEADLDPSYTLPERSKISSSNDTSAVSSVSSSTPVGSNTPPDRSLRGLILLISIVGGLIAIGIGIGYVGGRSPSANDRQTMDADSSK
jgi:hypothetical protein